MADSTGTSKAGRPRKSKDFPLFVHKGRGYWCKTVLGKHRYFGKVADDPDGKQALKVWNFQRDWLLAGEEPPPYGQNSTSKTVLDVCNYWIGHKETLLNAGELARRTYDEYFATCEFLMAVVGKTTPAKACGPLQFEKVRSALAKRYNANGQCKRITQIRSIFQTAYDDHVLEDRPNFGRSFKRPKAATLRKIRNSKGDQSYTPEEIRSLLSEATVNMRAMILLGLQAGFGNSDVACLPRSAVKDGWIVWARVKNAIPRRVPLWPETIEALEAAAKHADSLGETKLFFISPKGVLYCSDERTQHHRVATHFRYVRNRAKVANSHTFYDLRRTFETIAGETADQVAVDAIMGHTPSESNMAARYRQRISDVRLQAVVDHVREWLGELPKGGAK